MNKAEKLIEFISPVAGIVILLAFNYFFPEVVKGRSDIVIVIGIALALYGTGLAVLSRIQLKSLRAIPKILSEARDTIELLKNFHSIQPTMPITSCLDLEKVVSQSVHVLTYDLTWNIDEGGTPKLMFDAVITNLRRGIKYYYFIIDDSDGTKENLNLFFQRIKEELKDKPKVLKNFEVKFVKNVPLLFSFALFDMDLPGRMHHGFIFADSLAEPFGIPMTVSMFKRARNLLLQVSK